ncbi:MAG: hypothetical protein J6Y99_08410 [Bacteroidales bacterium]|nr:hypothetical protein [Bacteroidales bacterium]
MNFSIRPNRKKTKKRGYISFTQEELRQQALASRKNAEAYRLLEAAMSTRSNITQTDADGNTVFIEDVYPCTRQECDEMDGLLRQAEEAVRDPSDAAFRERLKELRAIVEWSRRKHWTIKRSLVFGCIITILLVFLYNFGFCKSDDSDYGLQDMVRNWSEQDTSIIWSQCEKKNDRVNFESAVQYKISRLQYYKFEYENVLSKADKERGRMEHASRQHDKDSLLVLLQKREQEMGQIKADYDALNHMSFHRLQESVLQQMKVEIGLPPIPEDWVLAYLIACGVVIPLYIYTSRQWGYYISLHRHEERKFNAFERFGFSLMESLLGKGVTTAFLPDYEAISPQPKNRKYIPVNFFILLLQAVVMFPCILVYCVFSLFTMAFATVVAIKRNYTWHRLAEKAAHVVVNRVNKTKAKASKN